jgi:branched-chain amino acid transport system permease protein
MSWDVYANVVIGGILTGLVYGLMALGLSVIFGVVRVVNFAHGEMMMVAMYAAVLGCSTWGIDPLWLLVPLAAVMFVVGYALQSLLVHPFMTRPDHAQFMLLVAVGMILTNGALILFGPDARSVQVDYALDSFELGPLLIDKVRLYAALAALAVAAALFAFFRLSPTGKAIRACADNYRGALVVGLDVRRLFALTFGCGTACVGAAGAMLVLLGDVTPSLGPAYTLLAFVIVIVGGLGSMAGALVAGVLIGVSEALAGLILAPSMKSMVSFGLLILVLLFRPQGLMGRNP